MCSRRNIPAHAGKTIQAVYQHQESPEHPRARGENVCPHTLLPCLKGTSPRTRGKHNPRDHTGYRVRNIPAHAGKTRFFIVLLSTYSEHPRARGENLDARFDMAADLGTSPRTRGKQCSHSRTTNHTGNIPAHAGKTFATGYQHLPGAEHPRARGENKLCKKSASWTRGTSPRTRGKPCPAPPRAASPRNIPAHAGKTSIVAETCSAHSEHPRARGENGGAHHLAFDESGTSPRTRGKLFPGRPSKRSKGNIPAHAGKTGGGLAAIPHGGEHPRARGENSCGLSHGNCVHGTSPRTRGKPTPTVGVVPIIEEHPRARGENACGWANPKLIRGTSPRTRGKRYPGIPRGLPRRNIPAHAGKTTSHDPAFAKNAEHPRARGENKA